MHKSNIKLGKLFVAIAIASLIGQAFMPLTEVLASSNDHGCGNSCSSKEIEYPKTNYEQVCGPNNDIIVPATGNFTATVGEWNSNRITVTYTAKPGYEFKYGKKEYKAYYEDDNINCLLENPITTYETVCGSKNDIVVPATGNFDAVVGKYDWHSKLTVTYTAKPGYEFKYGKKEYKAYYEDKNKNCLLENPITTYEKVCGPNNDKVVPATGNFTTAVSEWDDNKVIVTYTAEDGYFFQDNWKLKNAHETKTYETTYTDEDEACPVEEEPTEVPTEKPVQTEPVYVKTTTTLPKTDNDAANTILTAAVSSFSLISLVGLLIRKRLSL